MKQTLQHSKIYYFSFSTILGLIIGRVAGIFDTFLENPNPIIIYGVEMHHFYYGLILLCITLPLIFYIKKNKKIIILAGLGYGIMLDDLVLIIKLPYISYENVNSQYMSTLPFTIIFLAIFIIIGIYHFYIDKYKIKVRRDMETI